MTVTVSPERFNMVLFEPAAIRTCAESLLARLGMGDLDVHIEVDETTPIARVRTEVGATITVRAESGAFEDTRRPRYLSEAALTTALGSSLLRARDRLSGPFDDAPEDEQLTLAEGAAWDTYAVGRLCRLGYPVHRPRWLYNFRNRHGFTDLSDGVFTQVWCAEELSWGELASLSGRAAGAMSAV